MFKGTPIPLWVSDDMEERVCIGSVQELKDLSGYDGEITDLHRDKIDHITIPSEKGKGVLKRVEEVFDCWFESGSMPYASQHYPFENVGMSPFSVGSLWVGMALGMEACAPDSGQLQRLASCVIADV